MKTKMHTFPLILFTLLLFSYQSVFAQTEEKSKLNKALLTAVVMGDTKEAEALLQAGADVDARGSDGRTVLMSAVVRGQTEVVQLLLEAGADIEVKNGDGKTALTVAMGLGHERIEQVLRNAGAKE
jgi:ankyrin repeat protein